MADRAESIQRSQHRPSEGGGFISWQPLPAGYSGRNLSLPGRGRMGAWESARGRTILPNRHRTERKERLGPHSLRKSALLAGCKGNSGNSKAICHRVGNSARSSRDLGEFDRFLAMERRNGTGIPALPTSPGSLGPGHAIDHTVYKMTESEFYPTAGQCQDAKQQMASGSQR